MNWEQTIQYIRTLPEFKDLVEKAYFDENLELNVNRFASSEEFEETLKIINCYAPKAKSILDIGCGNGISAINFAINKYNVTAIEPDASDTVGAGAIKYLKNLFNLNNVEICKAFAEDINFKSNSFDVVYIRQAMHHANNLQQFVGECIRVLKPNGLLLTVRDHVVYNEDDKKWFLENHPLQKYYGGENAYSSNEYMKAIRIGGAKVVKELKYYESVLNYFPNTIDDIVSLKKVNDYKKKKELKNKFGNLASNWFVWNFYCLFSKYNNLDESVVPGRMYSYISIKK